MLRILLFIIGFGPLLGVQFDENLLNEPSFLQTFRSDFLLSKLFDPTTVKEGQQYCKEIVFNYKELLDAMEALKRNDEVGDPLLRKYKGFGRISPTTLRLIKTAADIQRYFGPLTNMRILHIGAGYGGLVRIFSEMGGIGSYTLLQHPTANCLAKMYLTSLGAFDIQYADDLHSLNFSDFDFVIIDSDFAGLYGTTSFVQKAVQQFPKGFVLKRGIASQFENPISWLISNGKKGKLYPDLYYDENVHYCFLWHPKEDDPPTALLDKASLHPSTVEQPCSALTNNVTQKGLEEQLMTYFKTKWLARTTKTPLLLTSFKLADRFQFSDEDDLRGPNFLFKKKVGYSKRDFDAESSILYTIPQQTTSRYKAALMGIKSPIVQVDWEDAGFKTLIRESLQLKIPVFEIHPPEGGISIALHDIEGNYEWIVEQLKRARRVFPKEHLFVYLFSDDAARAIVQLAKMWCDGNVEWAWGVNNHLTSDEKQLSDLHSLKNFDCLIGSESDFSLVGRMLSDFKLEIWPNYCQYDKNGRLVIDQLGLQFGP